MEKTFEINNFLIYFAFVLVFSCNTQANSEQNTDLKHLMTACHGCSESYSQSAAKSAWEPGESGTVFVFNYPARTLKKYYVYYEWIQVDPYQRVPIKSES